MVRWIVVAGLLALSTLASTGCAGECVARCSLTEQAPGSGYCVQYIGPFWDEDLAKDACKTVAGEFRNEHCCSSEGSVGRCLVDPGRSHETEHVYYSTLGWTAETAKAACDAAGSGEGNEFTP